MFKNSFKQVLKFILVMFFGLSFTTSALATTDENGAIIDNNTFATAYPIGYWQFIFWIKIISCKSNYSK